MNTKIWLSAVTAGVIAMGGALGVVLVGDKPTIWQLLASLVLGLVVAAKDIRSQLQLPPVEGDAAKPPTRIPLVLLVGLLGLAGCSLPFADQVITVKQVGDEISAEYSSLWKRGLITPEQDARAEQIHAEYRAAMAALALTLETAAQTGDQSSVPAKLRAVKVAIKPLLEMVTPLLGTPTRGPTLARELNLAVAQ